MTHSIIAELAQRFRYLDKRFLRWEDPYNTSRQETRQVAALRQSPVGAMSVGVDGARAGRHLRRAPSPCFLSR